VKQWRGAARSSLTGGEAYCGTEQVVDSLSEELTALAGGEVYVELKRRLTS
jgi:hypothetical protein